MDQEKLREKKNRFQIHILSSRLNISFFYAYHKIVCSLHHSKKNWSEFAQIFCYYHKPLLIYLTISVVYIKQFSIQIPILIEYFFILWCNVIYLNQRCFFFRWRGYFFSGVWGFCKNYWCLIWSEIISVKIEDFLFEKRKKISANIYYIGICARNKNVI